MIATLCTQFLSSLADNALLFAALALVRKDQFPAWSGPLLQSFFVGTYILLAPFVGALADAWPKGRVMVGANLGKFVGSLGMCFNLNPFLCYALVGVGAAAHSPAKYGILGEITRHDQLIKANGLIEAATVAGILLGAIAGGALTDLSLVGTLSGIALSYAAAAALALAVPRGMPAAGTVEFSLSGTLEAFGLRTRDLMQRPAARLALTGTGFFWGAGAALRFLVIAWVPVALHIHNNRVPAFLTAMVAAGIVVGAALAARFVRLEVVHRALFAGILIGVGVCLLPLVKTLTTAYLLMAFVGACSGFFLIPLDALLQKQAADDSAVGAVIAIQNLFENLSMLVMVSGYTAVYYLRVPVNDIATGFGVILALAMGSLILIRPAGETAPKIFRAGEEG